MRERTKSWRFFAASYSAFSERSPCAAAVWRSFGILKVSSCFRSASSFLSFARMGSSAAAISGAGSARDHALGDLARLLAVEASRVLLAQRRHDRAHRRGGQRGGDLADDR